MIAMVTNKMLELPASDQALPGRSDSMKLSGIHYVLGSSMKSPFPEGYQQIMFGLGCFWGAEKKFWDLEGVFSTAVGYSAGITVNPTYEEVCSGLTGHNEVVLVVFDPKVMSLNGLLQIFWESHDPTQGMRQGNDRGTQYRSGIYVFSSEQLSLAEQSQVDFSNALQENGFGSITTEICDAGEFYYAEEHHQQYLAKNLNGYCGLGGTGVRFSASS